MELRPMTPEPIALPPQDRQARDRIEQVASKLIALCGQLEARIVNIDRRLADVEHAINELGIEPNHV